MTTGLTFSRLASEVPQQLMILTKEWAEAAGWVIAQAEERVRREAHPDLFTSLLEGRALDSQGRVDLRNVVGFVNIDSLELALDGRSFPVTPRARDFCRALFPDRTDTGRPRHYAESLRSLYDLYPAPDLAYLWTADLTVDPLPLSDANQTNVITEKAPDLIKAAALLQAAMWRKSAKDIEIYAKNWADMLPKVNDRLARRRRDETTPRPRDTANRGGQ